MKATATTRQPTRPAWSTSRARPPLPGDAECGAFSLCQPNVVAPVARTALGKPPCLRVNTRSRSGAALAQLVEHRIRNAGVRCSSHLGGTILGPSLTPRKHQGNQLGPIFRGNVPNPVMGARLTPAIPVKRRPAAFAQHQVPAHRSGREIGAPPPRTSIPACHAP